MTEEKNHIQYQQSTEKIKATPSSDSKKAQKPRRIDGTYILSEIAGTFNFDKGLFYTIRELLLRPGRTVQTFILEDRNRLVKPILFLIICSFIYTLLQKYLGFEDGYMNYSFDDDSTSLYLFGSVTKNYGYANIFISLFIAAWIKVFFRKHNFNFFEILVLLCFLIGTGMLIFSFFASLDSLTGLPIIDKGFLIGVLYISWGTGSFFPGSKILNPLKGLLTYLLGLISFIILLLMMGSLVDKMLG
ncbi:MAG: DUF3667 domain-containing protein [Bacteroidota bacterium]